jgi:hypothetical protein
MPALAVWSRTARAGVPPGTGRRPRRTSPTPASGPRRGRSDLTEGEHVADAPVRPPASTNGHAPAAHVTTATGTPEATRLTADQARELKRLAHTAFGFAEGERRLRADLGFELGESLTLRHLAAHVTVARYQTLMDTYGQVLRQAVEADLPDFPSPAANG